MIIKFRVWDPAYKKIKPINGIFWQKDDSLESLLYSSPSPSEIKEQSKNKKLFSLKDYTLMQYSGLKDVHYQPIFDGDILQDIESNMLWVVMNNEEDAGFTVKLINTSGHIAHYLATFMLQKPVKVIGNIYEHPELRKQE